MTDTGNEPRSVSFEHNRLQSQSLIFKFSLFWSLVIMGFKGLASALLEGLAIAYLCQLEGSWY